MTNTIIYPTQKPQRRRITPSEKQLAIDTYREYVTSQREPEPLYTPEQVKLYLHTNPNPLPNPSTKGVKSSTETPLTLKLI